MSPAMELITWTVLLSLVITYAWWAYFRVWILRQDLFEIRDRLWDTAHEKGLLWNPDYLNTRDGINAMIRLAPWLSLPAMFRILFGGATRVTSTTSELPP